MAADVNCADRTISGEPATLFEPLNFEDPETSISIYAKKSAAIRGAMAAVRTGSTLRTHGEIRLHSVLNPPRGLLKSTTAATWSGLRTEISDIRNAIAPEGDRRVDRNQGGAKFLFTVQQLRVFDGGVGLVVTSTVSLGDPGPRQADTADSGCHQHDPLEPVHA